MNVFVSYWITAPLAKYVANFIFYNSVSPVIASSVVDMTSMALVQPINYFIVFPIMSSVSTILYRHDDDKGNLDSKYNLEPIYDISHDYEII
jgi:hypothetical protein